MRRGCGAGVARGPGALPRPRRRCRRRLRRLPPPRWPCPLTPACHLSHCRMRAALGLKPLKAEPEAPKGPTEAEAAVAAKKEEEAKAAQAAELAARIKQSRERRQKQEELDRTKKLGETGGFAVRGRPCCAGCRACKQGDIVCVPAGAAVVPLRPLREARLLAGLLAHPPLPLLFLSACPCRHRRR